MDNPIVIFIIVSVLTFCCSWLYKTIVSIKTSLHNLESYKYNRLVEKVESLSRSLTSTTLAMSKLIQSSEENIKRHITSERESVEQFIANQSLNHINMMIEKTEITQESFQTLFNMLENIQTKIDKSTKENLGKVSEINHNLTYAISESTDMINSQISAANIENKNSVQECQKSILTWIDTLIKSVAKYSDFIKQQLLLLEQLENSNNKNINNSILSLNSSIKNHAHDLTSTSHQVMKLATDLHHSTKNSFDGMNENLSKYFEQIQQIELLYHNLQSLYVRITEEEENIVRYGNSLNGMVAKHLQIAEMTSEMNKTSKEIFEFMKLYLLQSTLDNLKK